MPKQVDQPVNLTSVTGTDPAANTQFSQTVPAGEAWGLLCVTVALAQGATQTPLPILRIDDGTNLIYEGMGSTTAQASSTTTQYAWAPGLPLTGQVGAGVNVHSSAPLPAGLVLLPGYRITSVSIGLGANSDFGAPQFFVAKYRAS